MPEKPSADSLPDIATGLSQAEARTLTIAALMHFIRGRLQTAGCPEPEIESRLIVQYAARTSAARLIAGLNELLPPGASDVAFDMLARRERREPLPYILGEREFYGRTFKVDRRVLIPRPETELLVERAIEFGRERGGIRIADIGTGSGALAVTLALELPDAVVFATDTSSGALDVARSNAVALGAAARVTFAEGDLTGPLRGTFSIVASNPPYVNSRFIDAGEPELRYEPRLALDGGPDGLEVIRRLISALPSVLDRRESLALVEVDPLTSTTAAALAREAFPDARVTVLQDLAGLDRCVEIRAWPGAEAN